MSTSSMPGTHAITFDVPHHLVEAFTEITNDFFARAHEGTTPAQRAAKVRAQDRERGLTSLVVLLDVAGSDAVQTRVIAAFLAGLYNGEKYPFDLRELRRLDDDLFEHCLAVLRVYNAASSAVRKYFSEDATRWQSLIERWTGLRDENAVEEQTLPGGQSYLCDYVAYSDSPGYRDVTLFATIRTAGKVNRAVGLSLTASSCARLAEDLLELHRRAWENGPAIDATEGESRPPWI
ncbi:hypothetical protein BTHE68_41120 [Burkholderia sp. THE68]|uniref:DUF7673 family protein n=1 Tax=Burkholderia sp. THE68 TaxID=758782 RepID=UPI001317A2CB|nr:hypothetical protein [Burkholderia sp. THE68]BBU30378.1 hypothetical protein BTHE68_41120 [Burkholderia sp. THE68]